jgi:hypothetical protein
MDNYNTCEEIINFLYKKYEESCVQGQFEIGSNIYHVDGFMPTTKDLTDGIYILRTNTLFLIGTTNDDKFILYIFKGPKFYMDQTLGIVLPLDLKDDMNDYLMYEVLS